MKTTFKTDEIAHIWAHKSAPCGKAPSALSFNGAAISSYSTEIARHITHKGKEAIVICDSSYSVTTTKHQNYVKCAIPSHIPVFWIGKRGRGDSLHDIGGKELYAYAVEQAAEALAKAEKARKSKDWHKHEAASWLDRAKFVNEFFSLRRTVDEKAIERLKVASATAERKAKAARLAREAKKMAEQQAAFAAWLRGEKDGYFSQHLFPVAFRIEGEELVSTLGARVPLQEAKRAFAFALSKRETGWQRNGTVCRVGHYQLDSIGTEGVKAGCHSITWQEMERIAPLLAI